MDKADPKGGVFLFLAFSPMFLMAMILSGMADINLSNNISDGTQIGGNCSGFGDGCFVQIDEILNQTTTVEYNPSSEHLFVDVDDFLNTSDENASAGYETDIDNESWDTENGTEPGEPAVPIEGTSDTSDNSTSETGDDGFIDIDEYINITENVSLNDSENKSGFTDVDSFLNISENDSGNPTPEPDLNLSASNETGTLADASAMIIGKSYKLDGKTRFEINDTPVYPGTGDFSVTVRINTSDTSDGSIVSSGEGSQDSYWGIEKAWADDRAVLFIKLNDGDGEVFGYGTRNIADGQVHLIAFVLDAENGLARGYLDGNLELEFNSTVKGITDSSSIIFVGNGNIFENNWFRGEIADVKTYQRKLTDSEINGGAVVQ